jgi:prepilin-type processing-associated H-X9-DG protein
VDEFDFAFLACRSGIEVVGREMDNTKHSMGDAQMAESSDFWKRAFQWGVVLIWGAVLLSLFLPAFEPRRPTYRTECLNNVRNIVLALHNYHSFYGSLPPAYIADANGRPMHSWRVLILPYLDRTDLYEIYRFDEPWDGPNNSKLHDLIVDAFRCPQGHGGARSTETSYVAIVGPETIWPGDGAVKLDDVSDGLGSTLLVVEIANSGIHWMEPRDLHVSQMTQTINSKSGQGISSGHPGGAVVGFADGRVRFLSDNTPAATIEALLTIRGGEKIPDNY